ncbi:MAG: hypothetical protein AMS14_07980 [Planctomycetes bacterium DG_20]|nr:MAG: hypothetical protein AMS14_07980 [Planctomycetes bacterium DG_20]
MLDALLAAPVLVKVVGSLALILVVNRLAGNLVVSVAAGTLALGLWTGQPVSVVLGTAWSRLRSADQLCLMGTIFLVIWLSCQMAAAGVMEDLVGSVRSRLSRRGSMAVLPAVIGFLPMPGGAIFSAPMLDQVDADGSVDALLKTKTNYWFRHIWEYWWPLYPGVLLAVGITRLEMWQFMLLQMPLTLFAVAAGYVLLLRRIHPTGDAPAPGGGAGPRPHFLALILPILVVIGTYAAVRLGLWRLREAWPGIPAPNMYLPMMVGLVLAMITLGRQRPLGWGKWKPILFSPRTVSMVVIVGIIRIYGGLIEAPLGGGPSLVDAMQAEIDRWAVGLFGRESELVDLVVIMLLPFIAGITTGVCFGFVGASFPVVVGLLGPDPSPARLMAAATLAFGFGYMGMMLSPVHVCLIVTNQHFRTQLLHSLRDLLLPAAAVLALVVAYHFAIRWVGG